MAKCNSVLRSHYALAAGTRRFLNIRVVKVMTVRSKNFDSEIIIWQYRLGPQVHFFLQRSQTARRGGRGGCHFWEANPSLLTTPSPKRNSKRSTSYFCFSQLFSAVFGVKMKKKNLSLMTERKSIKDTNFSVHIFCTTPIVRVSTSCQKLYEGK